MTVSINQCNVIRTFQVYHNSEVVDEYKYFNGHAGAIRFDVDSDLPVGPFYCDAADAEKAWKELTRYMRSQWNRDMRNVTETRI